MLFEFYLLTDQDKKDMSTYLVNNGWNLYPPEAGKTNTKCIICKKDKNCTGHYGLIDLEKYIVHPLFISKFKELQKELKIPKGKQLKDINLPDPYKGLIMKYILVPPPGIRTKSDVEWPDRLSRLYLKLIEAIKSKKSRVEKIVKEIYGSETKTGIIELLSGKDGVFRKICFGKRINSSARSVITGDPNLDIDQVYIPKVIADNLYTKCTIKEDNRTYYLEKDIPLTKEQAIPGISAIRKIEDDDLIFINRQPTLSYGSLLTFRVKIRKDIKTNCSDNNTQVKTIGIHPNVTKTFNADFDGDEMNLFFFPESKDMERCHIINFPECINSIQDSKSREYLGIESLDNYGLTVSLEDIINKQYEGTGLQIMVESGAKGNKRNVEQIMHSVGKQYLRGKLIGECTSSYTKGLSADEFFIHQCAAREGVVSSGVSTSDTGYINRKGSRILGDVLYENGIVKDNYGIIGFEF